MGTASIRVAGRLLVGGQQLELVKASVAYELNGIPRAEFVVAVGRTGFNLVPSQIHKVAGQLSPEARVQYLCKFTVISSSEPYDLPTGEFRLFDGYLCGTSLRRSKGGSLQLVLHAQHWLVDMDYSSALSGRSHPLNPSQFSYMASHNMSGSGATSWTPKVANGWVSETSLAEDFWKKALLPYLTEITARDQINTMELSFLNLEEQTNAEAARALARFTTTGGKYVPLVLDYDSPESPLDLQSIAAAIWSDLQNETMDTTLASTTLWSKLVGDFASRYMFAIVPRVEDALVVPYIPGLKQTWKYKISGKDYDLVNGSSTLQRKLRGVGIFSGITSRTGNYLSEPGQDPQILGIGGWYSPKNAKTGMVLLKQGPRWLTSIIAPDRYSQYSSGAGVTPIGNTFHPGEPSTGGGSSSNPPPPPKEIKKKSKYIMDAFAKSLYVYEQLRLRQLELSGKLRFDIAPGSTIRVDPSFDKFIPGDALTAPLIGDVTRVSYHIDSNAPGQVATSFNLSHLRTEWENNQDDYSVERPPLWKNAWTGCGLISRYD